MTSLSAESRRKQDATPLYRAKLSRPNLGRLVLDRPRLVRALTEHAQRSLTLLIADAGYGKSTLLASFAKSLSRPVVWYSLTPSDADPIVFSRYLLEGFRREAPRFGRVFQRILEEFRPGASSGEMLGGTFANELVGLKGSPYLLVLDDFQDAATNPHVIAFMDTLLRQLPASVRIVVASRSVPPLALDRLRAQGQVFELDSEELRLSRDELDQLFGKVYRRPLTAEELASLEETTLGWPTAIHLVHESLERSADARLEDVLARFRASDLELHDYLSSEVYARLDPGSRHMLERTSALSRFDADLAARLGGVRDARPVLDALARRGLLRTFGIGEQASYECHELVRRFVRHELEARAGAPGTRELAADTASALEARGEPERALRHYLQAGRVAEAARIVRDLAPELLRQGRPAALLQYLSDLPRERVREEPLLTLALADAQRAVGSWDEAQALYKEVLDEARRLGTRDHECSAMAGLGRLLNLRGMHEQALGIVESGLARAHGIPVELRRRLLQIKGAAHFYLGHHDAAIRILDEVRSLLKDSADREMLVPTVHNLAMAYAAQGRFREASKELRAALAQVRGTSSPRAPLYLSNLATLLAELGELADARRAAEEGLLAAQRFSNRAQEVTCHQALAQILAQGGDFDGALAALKEAEELNDELRMDLIAADLLALRGRIFCGRGEYRRAVAFLTEAIERLAGGPDGPRLVEFKATLAWCELRAGRVRAARDLLQSLVRRADADENDYQRMRVHYWLGEALLALGEQRAADRHLGLALRLVRERGYLYFLKVQAREEPASLLHALEREVEVPTTSAALVEAGGAVEEPLLKMLAGAPAGVAEAAIAVLGEVGRRAAHEALEGLAKTRRALRPAIRAALRHIGDRTSRGSATGLAETRATRLALFGPPRLYVDGRLVPPSAWRTQRAFHILIYLSLHPRGASRDDLLEHFWPGRQAAAGRRNFHPSLSYIRSVLPRAQAQPILREWDIYRLNPAYPLTCDAWDLDHALEEARSARDPRARRKALQRAAELTTGTFLQGFYASWADELQARTRDRVEKCLLDLGAQCAEAGDYEEALSCFRRAVEIDEYRESTWLAMIECLIKLGNRRAALAEYAKLQALLRSGLSVDPLPETQEAARKLWAGSSVHGWPEPRALATGEPNGAQRVSAFTQVGVKSRVGELMP